MQSFSETNNQVSCEVKLSIFSPPYKLVPPSSLSATRIFLKSAPNSPLMLIIRSADQKTLKHYPFAVGDSLLSSSNNQIVPKISNFELESIPSEELKPNISSEPIQNTCRICLDSSNPEDLISPCMCKGFQQYVHEACLKIWLLQSEKSEKELTACEVCKGKYSMNFVYSSNCLACNKESLNFWISFGILFFAIAIFICVCTIQSYQKVPAGIQIFVYAILIIVALITLIVCCIFFKKIFSASKVIDWKILNYSPENQLNS